jgi:hypothetical protein
MRSYDDIAACAARYAEARRHLVAADESLQDYEAVLRSRVALAECLIASGWTPPEDVQHLLALDRQLLAEPRGVMESDGHALTD